MGNRDKLIALVQIMSASEAVGFIAGKIAERDDFNREFVFELGGELPEWTGKDS